MSLTPELPHQVSPPEFAVTAALPHAVTGVDVLALPVLPPVTPDGSPLLGPGADDVATYLGIDLVSVLESAQGNGRAGQVVTVPVPLGAPDNADLCQVLLVGIGAGTPTDFRRAGAAVARASRDRGAVATTIPAVDPATGLEPFVIGAVLGSFGFHWRSTAPEHVPVRRVVLAELHDDDAPTVERAVEIGGASWRARALAWVPSNLKSPAWLAEQAESAGAAAGLEVTVWDEQRLAAEGFGGILGVGQASATPPRLIRLDYVPAQASRRTPTVVLVGKGITFDTGGLSIKPAEGMTTMKRDMTGGAVVMATMTALAAVGCPVKVVGLVAAAENAVSGNALRPGDVIRHYGGRTTEVTNTDAEGRLVMADALAYAVAHLDPAVLVDVATLTGAMKVALGLGTGGLFANDDALAAALDQAGSESGELLWRMPLSAAYEDKLASKVADADNAGGGPGAITAALFLQHFVGGLPWAHLDIASVGDAPEESFEWTKGPTGFGVRALLSWLGRPDPWPAWARGDDPAVNGLTVRWSLVGAGDAVLAELAEYVAGTSHARFTGLPGLAHKTWRSVPGEWFEGCYVFESDQAREEFQRRFTEDVADAPGTRIVGAPPVLIEACRIVAVAEGAAGFNPTPRAE